MPLQDLRRLLRRLLRGPALSGLAHELAWARRRLFEIQLRLQRLAADSRRRRDRSLDEIGAAALPRQSAELLAEASRLEQRRHRLGAVLGPLRGLRQEVEDAEELALAELLAGQAPLGWQGQVQGWQERLRRQLAPALLLPDEGAGISLLLTEAGSRADGARPFDFGCGRCGRWPSRKVSPWRPGRSARGAGSTPLRRSTRRNC